jgi:ArsR family metal-binding transcriptional regulator
MFLETITLMRTLPCLADSTRMIVIGKPSRDLEEVIPYLATLPGVIGYNPGTCTLTFRRQPGFITIQSGQVSITKVLDVQEGLGLLNDLTASINAVWNNREKLVAVMQIKRSPRPLDIWTLLPQSNCGKCGEATCMAFAVGLLQSNRGLDECPVLVSDPNFTDRRVALETML